jgi:hypothetical protein
MKQVGIKTGDEAHCTGHGIISKAISKATKSEITHTAVFIWVWGELCVIEAQRKGVNLITFDNWQRKYNYDFIATRKQVQVDEKEYSKKAMKFLAVTGYDFALLCLKFPFSILASLITGKEFVPKMGPKESNKMTCTELIATLRGLENPHEYSPNKYFEKCIDLGDQVVYVKK